MSFSTGALPLATTDSYNDPHVVQLRCWGASSVLIIITTNAAAIRLAEAGGRPDSAPAWQDEFYAPPGAYPIDAEDSAIDSVQARSATPGKPANVSMVAFR